MNDSGFKHRKVSVPPVVAAKWSQPVADEGFVPFPKRFLRCLSRIVSDIQDLQVVLAVVDYLRPGLTRGPSSRYLAFVAGLPVEQFQKRLEMMQSEKRWLTLGGSWDELQINLAGLMWLIEVETTEGPPSDVDGDETTF